MQRSCKELEEFYCDFVDDSDVRGKYGNIVVGESGSSSELEDDVTSVCGSGDCNCG